jgi:Xaa-Pro dipeptidase
MAQDVQAIQEAIREAGLDGWLFYDFHNRDVVGMRILGLDPGKMSTRRWLYFIPARGEPAGLVHRIESGRLDGLPGEKRVYLAWKEFEEGVRSLIGGARKVAMQYSPRAAVPTVSLVDGGTIELVRELGAEIHSSADLISRFEAVQTPEALEDHKRTGVKVHAALEAAFEEIRRRAANGETCTEYEIQQLIVERFEADGLTCEDHPPIVGVGPHSGDPHYEPAAEGSSPIGEGDFVLIDLWARTRDPGSVYFDITWTAYVGREVPEPCARVFDVVRRARDAVVERLVERFGAGKDVAGWELDDVSRGIVAEAGYGEFFIHRTGHNIGQDLHGNGANLDNLETRDERRILPGTCFSVEPGIYLDEFGVRSEINVIVTHEGKVEVTGPSQERIVALLG